MYDAHPAIATPMRTRIDYARVVASLGGLDGHDLGTAEVATLRRLCGALGLPPGATEGVLLFARAPHPDKVRESLEELRDSDLRLTLVTDLVALAMADGKYNIAERKQIHALGAMLLVTEEEIARIEDYVAASMRSSDTEHVIVTDLDDIEEGDLASRFGGELAAGIAAAAVPIAVLWMFSPRGLSMSGVTMALDHLGFGMGPLVGVAVDVTFGLGSYALVRVLYRSVVGDDDDDDE